MNAETCQYALDANVYFGECPNGTDVVSGFRFTNVTIPPNTRMGQHGAKLSEIQHKLGHKNIATTSLYLQALMNEENPYAEAIESAIGVGEPGDS